MKLIFKTYTQVGAMYIPAATSELDVGSEDYGSILELLGYKMRDDGKWSQRTAYNEIKTVEVH